MLRGCRRDTRGAGAGAVFDTDMQYRKRVAIIIVLNCKFQSELIQSTTWVSDICSILKSIYMIGANIKISLYHELAILVLNQGRGKLLNIENHRMSH